MTLRASVRPANPKDAEQIVDLEDEVFEKLLSHGPQLTRFTRVQAMRQGKLRLRDFGHLHLVAESGRTIVGYALGQPYTPDNRQFFRWSSVYFLNQIAVGKAYQKQGVGHLLLDSIVRKARALGYATLAANIDAGSAEFYANAGWIVSAPGEALAWVDEASKEDVALLPGGSVFSEIASFRTQPPHADAGYNLMAYKPLPHAPRLPLWFVDAADLAADNGEILMRHVASLVIKDRSLIRRIHISLMVSISQHLVELVGQAETEAILMESLVMGTVSLADRRSFLRFLEAEIQQRLGQNRKFREVRAA